MRTHRGLLTGDSEKIWTCLTLRVERDAHQFVAIGTDGRPGYVPHSNVYVPRYWTESPRVFVDDGDAKVLAKWKDNATRLWMLETVDQP